MTRFYHILFVLTTWKWKNTNEYISVILMLMYCGCRIGELLDLKTENVYTHFAIQQLIDAIDLI